MPPTQRDTVTHDWSTMFEALSDDYRRRLLVNLLEHNPQDELQIPEDVHVGETELEVLQVELYHRHLPKLEELGFIEWNQRSSTVSKGQRFEAIRPLLELVLSHQDELPDEWMDFSI